MEIRNRNLEILIESLQLLAADYKVQREVLPDHVHVPDEVALIFGDSVVFIDDLANDRLVTPSQKTEVEKLDRLLEKMSNNKELWTPEALEQNPKWTSVRIQASNILNLFGKSKQRPNLFWLQYIQTNQGSE